MNKTWSTMLIGGLLTICIGLGGWNLHETHQLAITASSTLQMVIDGKEYRLQYQSSNDSDHKLIGLKLDRMDGRLGLIEKKLQM